MVTFSMKLSTMLLFSVVIWKKKKPVNITIKNVTEDYYGEVTVIHYYQLKQPSFSNLWEMVKATTSWLFLMGYQRFITSTQNTGLP